MLELTSREIKEVQHAMLYKEECDHGTVGHNILVLLDKFAKDKGFELEFNEGGSAIFIPKDVKVVDETKR